MLNSSDLLWIRNVKRKKGEQFAYYDMDANDDFVLHWSQRYVSGDEALKPQIGDIILLFQTPSYVNSVLLTHLVTPISNHFEDCHETNPEYPWGRKVATLARVPQKDVKIAPSELKFQSVNQTHSYSIESLISPYSLTKTQSIIWDLFKGHFNPSFSNRINDFTLPESDLEIDALEGRERWRLKLHRARERDQDIITAKKHSADRLNCECCNISFEDKYGDLGKNFIECHHRVPINKGERITRLEDLALVCSNCHRMLHRKNSEGNYYSVEQLKVIIQERNK